MNAPQFQTEFRALLDRVFAAPDGVPAAQVIIECERAKALCLTLMLQAEAAAEARALQTKIIPANGALPKPPPRG